MGHPKNGTDMEIDTDTDVQIRIDGDVNIYILYTLYVMVVQHVDMAAIDIDRCLNPHPTCQLAGLKKLLTIHQIRS